MIYKSIVCRPGVSSISVQERMLNSLIAGLYQQN